MPDQFRYVLRSQTTRLLMKHKVFNNLMARRLVHHAGLPYTKHWVKIPSLYVILIRVFANSVDNQLGLASRP
jgi:hypothetical protein